MIFKQFFDPVSSSFSYILANKKGGEALIIDSVLEQVNEYIKFLDAHDLKLIKAIDTHIHADHISAMGALRDRTFCMTMIGQEAKTSLVSQRFKDGDIISIEDIELKAIFTPGHTQESYCFYTPGMLFTGDTLFIRGNGRADFQGGSARQLYHSITELLFKLPEDTLVWPGHDYKNENMTTLGTEKKKNPRISGKSEAEFIEIMDNLNLPYPKKMEVAVPANLALGNDILTGLSQDEIVTLKEAKNINKDPNTMMIDLRENSEIKQEGTIEGSIHIPYKNIDAILQDSEHPLSKHLKEEKPVYFFCAHGERSSLVVKKLSELGHKNLHSFSFDITDWFKK